MIRLLALAMLVFLTGCNPAQPSPLVPAHVPHKPHLDEKVAKIQVLDFYTTWCGPCRLAAPTVDILISQGHKVRKIDAEKEPKLAAKYKVTSYPTFIVLRHGKEIYRTHNVQELRRYLNKRLWHHQRGDDEAAVPNRNRELAINNNVWVTPNPNHGHHSTPQPNRGNPHHGRGVHPLTPDHQGNHNLHHGNGHGQPNHGQPHHPTPAPDNGQPNQPAPDHGHHPHHPTPDQGHQPATDHGHGDGHHGKH